MAVSPLVPRYGSGALVDLTLSLLAALGVPGGRNVLGLPAARRICVLLIDGLGWQALRAHPQEAPYLNSLPGRSLTAGFPATTVTSLGSLGTGLSPAGHGLVGYRILNPQTGRLLNCLRWDDEADPLTFQPLPTVYDRATAAGVYTAYVAKRRFRNSGLTRAVHRGATYLGADTLGQLVARTERALRQGDRAYVTVYHSDLDSIGHRKGAGSAEWRHELVFVDALAERIAAVLPGGAALYVTADHGMVNPGERIDLDAVPELREGVVLLGGEGRARHLYVESGAAADVAAIWRELLGDRVWVQTRDEAVAAGWFGPASSGLLARIGDVLAVPYGDVALVATRTEPAESALVGMHGSMTRAEQLVPLLSPPV